MESFLNTLDKFESLDNFYNLWDKHSTCGINIQLVG